MSDVDEIHYDEVNVSIQAYMNHPYLTTSGVHQVGSRFHFGVARAVLQTAGTSAQQARWVLQAVLLLQQGLSIHDKVEAGTAALRKLRVLAGDYDSSRHYWILANAGQIELLAQLSTAVCQINEAKVALLSEPADLSAERWLSLRENVEGGLLYALAVHFLPDASLAVQEIRSLVRAFIVSEDVRSDKAPRSISPGQTYDWVADAIERVLRLPSNSLLRPIGSFLIEHLVALRTRLEAYQLAEGGRHG